jgi:hypothetical protein
MILTSQFRQQHPPTGRRPVADDLVWVVDVAAALAPIGDQLAARSRPRADEFDRKNRMAMVLRDA